MKTIPVRFICDVNNKHFELDGNIEGKPHSGICRGTIKFNKENLPKDFYVDILSYVHITGYPEMSQSIGCADNPFKIKGNFKTKRILNLNGLGTLNTTYWSENRGTDLEKIVFNVTGNVNLPSGFNGIKPTIELWTPIRKSHFKGEFMLSWKTDSGVDVFGHAITDYYFESDVELIKEQIRIITFNIEKSENIFSQEEHIKLYDKNEWELMQIRNIAA